MHAQMLECVLTSLLIFTRHNVFARSALCSSAAAPAFFFKFTAPAKPPPPERIYANFEAPQQYQPCAYQKHAVKRGGTSLSCATNGYTLAVGKYGAINIVVQAGDQAVVAWTRDEKTGKVAKTTEIEEYAGEGANQVQVAPAPSPA